MLSLSWQYHFNFVFLCINVIIFIYVLYKGKVIPLPTKLFIVGFLDPYISHLDGPKSIWFNKKDAHGCLNFSKSCSHFLLYTTWFSPLILRIYTICLLLSKLLFFAPTWHEHNGLFFCFLQRFPRSFISGHMLETLQLIRKLQSFHSDVWVKHESGSQ